jgi:hypothetical protein
MESGRHPQYRRRDPPRGDPTGLTWRKCVFPGGSSITPACQTRICSRVPPRSGPDRIGALPAALLRREIARADPRRGTFRTGSQPGTSRREESLSGASSNISSSRTISQVGCRHQPYPGTASASAAAGWTATPPPRAQQPVLKQPGDPLRTTHVGLPAGHPPSCARRLSTQTSLTSRGRARTTPFQYVEVDLIARDRPALRQEPVASHVESRSWFGTYASRRAVPSRTGRPRAHRHRRLPDVQTCDPVEQHVHHAALLTCRSRSATPGGLSARHRPRCSQQQSTDSREAPRHAPLQVTRPVCADVAKRHPRFSSPAMFGRRPKCHTPLASSVPISSGEIACHAQTEARFSPVRRCNRTG